MGIFPLENYSLAQFCLHPAVIASKEGGLGFAEFPWAGDAEVVMTSTWVNLEHKLV